MGLFITESPKLLDQVAVKVIGSSQPFTVTDHEGRFELPNILTVSHYPIYIETDRKKGYTHRYRILSKDVGRSVKLNRVPNRIIANWSEDFERPIHEDGNLVMVPLPRLVRSLC